MDTIITMLWLIPILSFTFIWAAIRSGSLSDYDCNQQENKS